MLLALVAKCFNQNSTPPSLADVSSSSPSPSISLTTPTPHHASPVQPQDLAEAQHPYTHAMLAGGFGGLTGDMLMHSLDTVKTRQQGDPHRPPKYTHLGPSYWTILREEGLLRGLYGGVSPAALGSFAGTSVFFGTYEWSKRFFLSSSNPVPLPPSVAYFSAGLFADLCAAPLYVPSEVLKTRLQLQGRYNNPHFHSGYNYRSMWDATQTIIRTEGLAALYHGFRATLYRDLPFSALQFAFYEKAREWAKYSVGSPQIGIPLEILTGAVAGGLAGTMTCPLDVVKTRIQTQIVPGPKVVGEPPATRPVVAGPAEKGARPGAAAKAGAPAAAGSYQTRLVSTSSASSSILKTGTVTLDTPSVVQGLRLIYRTEGIAGWFRGVGPRGVWTSVQSGAMFLLYQTILGWLSDHPLVTM